MKHTYILCWLMFGFILPFSVKAQVNTAKLMATCIDIKGTKKHHPSSYFTFKVEKVIEGTFSDTIINTKEIFMDFGGKQIWNKLRNKKLKGEDYWSNHTNEVIIKLIKTQAEYEVLWISELAREKELESLEQVAFSLIEAIERNDYSVIEPFLPDTSSFTRKQLTDISNYEKKHPLSYRKAILYDLLNEQAGLSLYVGGIALNVILIEQIENSTKWVIKGVKENN